MGKWFKKTFHPSKCKKEAEKKAADAKKAVESQARQELDDQSDVLYKSYVW